MHLLTYARMPSPRPPGPIVPMHGFQEHDAGGGHKYYMCDIINPGIPTSPLYLPTNPPLPLTSLILSPPLLSPALRTFLLVLLLRHCPSVPMHGFQKHDAGGGHKYYMCDIIYPPSTLHLIYSHPVLTLISGEGPLRKDDLRPRDKVVILANSQNNLFNIVNIFVVTKDGKWMDIKMDEGDYIFYS